eukprot:COSAG04_NODE_3972_length_2387_cov_32.962413_3_plen_86_part_00
MKGGIQHHGRCRLIMNMPQCSQGSNIVESVQRMVSHDCVGAAQVRRVLLDSRWTGTKGDKRRGGKSNGDSTAIDECAEQRCEWAT